MGSLCSSGVVGFTRVRPGCRWVHPESLDSFGCALGDVGFTQLRLVGRLAHQVSHGFTLGVVGFIPGGWDNSCAPRITLGSSGVVGLTRVCPEGR